MPNWTTHERELAKQKTQAPKELCYACECEVAKNGLWSVVQLCKIHRDMFKDKSFTWLVNQLLSGVWPPAVKTKDDEVGKVEEGA